MNTNDNTSTLRKAPRVVIILTGIVFLFILCACALLVLLLVYGPQLIYLL